MRMPRPAATGAHAAPYLRSLSRMRNLGRWSNGVASRSCRATQASVGWRVTPTCTTRRVPSAITKQANNGRQARSVTGRKSHAQIVAAWLRRIGRPGLPARPRRAVATQIGPDRALRHADAELAQCAPDPLGTPARVLGRQPPDQGDGLRREGRAARPRVRSPPPACLEPRAVPAQQGRGLDEEQGLAPGADPAGAEHQERPIRWPHVRTFDAPTQHEQLLAQEGVLGAQLRPTSHQVSTGTGRLRQRQRPRPAACTERVTQPGTERQKPMTATAKESQRCPPHCRRARAARMQGDPPHRRLPARAVSPRPEAAFSPRMDNEP